MNRRLILLSCLGAVVLWNETYVMSSDNQELDCVKFSFELHFQETFSGERIDILTGDEVRAQVVAKTRFQIGLATIEALELCDEEEVTPLIRELNLQATFKVDVTKPFVTVNMMDGQLRVGNTARSPGYL